MQKYIFLLPEKCIDTRSTVLYNGNMKTTNPQGTMNANTIINTIWVLGASDPEMEMIERLLTQCGEQVEHATAGGSRVRPGNAYRATPHECGENDCLVAVECGWVGTTGAAKVVVCDHHLAGDPGFGRPPAEFLSASSLGQVVALLAQRGRLPQIWGSGIDNHAPGRGRFERAAGAWFVSSFDLVDDCGGYPTEVGTWVRVPGDHILAAAADHCLAAAYRGECPGVDPDELMVWRATSRARFQGRNVADVLADVAATSKALLDAPVVPITPLPDCPVCGGTGVWDDTHGDNSANGEAGYVGCRCTALDVVDMRREPPWPELPEAAARMGESYVSGPLMGPDGRQKITCAGNKEVVEAFLAGRIVSGLVDMYGDPARGFAGGYIAP